MITRSDILEKTREVIYECAPELEGTPLEESTVINTDTGVDSMGFTLIIGDVVTAIEKRLPNA